MHINKLGSDTSFMYQNLDKKEKNTNPNSSCKINIDTLSPANPQFYAAYSNINFRGRTIDNTNFREDLKKRAQISQTELKINEKNIKADLFKTKHSEYVLHPDNNKIYKLRFVDDKKRIEQQVLASKLYQNAGIRTPEYIPFEKNGKTGYMVEVIEEKFYPAETNTQALYNSFVVDAWLGNRNGLSKNNTQTDKNGNPVKMSVSGSLDYRASGKPKDSPLYGYSVKEIKTMRDSSINPDASKALERMSDEELVEALKNFQQSYSGEKTEEIVKENSQDTSMAKTLNARQRELNGYKRNLSNELTLKKRGFINGKSDQATNLSNFKEEYILEITDEQWEALKERNLLQSRYDLKKFDSLDYKNLAEMTDEEHQKAIERNLYSSYYEDIDGLDINYLSKLSDEQWKRVEDRDLPNLRVKHNASTYVLCQYISDIIDISDDDWSEIEKSGILDAYGATSPSLKNFLNILHSEEVQNLTPSFSDRVRQIVRNDKNNEFKYENLRADDILDIATCKNDGWNRIIRLTNNFRNENTYNYNLKWISSLDEETYQKADKRNILLDDKNTSIKELALISDEVYENIERRNLKERFPDNPENWIPLAELSDEEYQLAHDKNLFDERCGSFWDKSLRFMSGKAIKNIVTSLNDEDWKNVEKRGLLKDYHYHDEYGNYRILSGVSIVPIAKLTDDEFINLNKLNEAGKNSRIYLSTYLELVSSLNDEQINRIIDRGLLQKYVDTHESYDDYTEDAPILSEIAKLNDDEYQKFIKQNNDCKTIKAKTLIIKAEDLGLDKKESISELNRDEKREYLQLLLSKSYTFLSDDFQNNFDSTKIVPKNSSEFIQTINKLVQSLGIDTKPLNETEKSNFFRAIDEISSPDSEFKKLNLKDPQFKLNIKYPRQNFMKDVSRITENMDASEKMKVWDYFGFELKTSQDGSLSMSGYPALIYNGEKLSEIQNHQTREIIEELKPYVKKFSEENSILPDNKFISQEMADTLNNLFRALPEFYSIIGKEQHKTQDYTLDVHTFAVLQECLNSPEFAKLNSEEQQTLILSALLHDITKQEKIIDKSHPTNSSYDAYYILEKLNLDEQQHLNIYQLIKNHDMLEQCNKKVYDSQTQTYKSISPDIQSKLIQQYAYNLRADNLANLECMLTKADLLSIKRDGSFYYRFEDVLDKVSKKLKDEIRTINKTAISLPQTKIPKASEMTPDGEHVVDTTTYDKEGTPIKNKVLYLSEDLDLSKYGFDKGVHSDNFNVLVHGFDTEGQQATLGALSLVDRDALLSTSYVVYDKGNYHVFRPQGFIMNVTDDNIGVAYYRDFGSGYRKNVDNLTNYYLNGAGISLRKYFSDLVKKELNLDDNEYIELYKEIKNKPMNVLEEENPQIADSLKKIFKEMNIHKRRYGRDYNEILAVKGKPVGVFYEGKNYKVEDIPEFLRKYAEENDMPIIYFGE